MKRNLLALLLGFALLGAVLAIGGLVLGRATTTPEDRAFADAFREVAPGVSEQRVIELLGEPGEKSAGFFLAQETGFEAAYRRAAESGSAYYLVWRRGLDLVYCVGIDAAGKVTIAEVGGT